MFRVDYSNSEDLAKLCEAVSNKALGSVDRLNILDDLFRFGDNLYKDYPRFIILPFSDLYMKLIF